MYRCIGLGILNHWITICRRLLQSSKIDFDNYESKSNLNRLCRLESLQFRRIFISLVVLFMYINFHPDYLSRFAITISRSARRPKKLIFNPHGRIFSCLILQKTGALWNCLPPRLTTLGSLTETKRHLRILHCKVSVRLHWYPFDVQSLI